MLSLYQISDETTETLAEYTYKKQLELMSNVHVYGVGGGGGRFRPFTLEKMISS